MPHEYELWSLRDLAKVLAEAGVPVVKSDGVKVSAPT